MTHALREALPRYYAPDDLERIERTRVGIAGAGGIGSNAAFMLVRSGVRRLVLVDDDVVEASNLNRQQYFPVDLGRPKVLALADRLLKLTPDLDIVTLNRRVDEEFLPALLPMADIWVEAMDGAANKRLFVEACLLACLPVTACSGVAGIGGPALTTRQVGLCTLVGDMVSDVADAMPYAPRVTACAALMADAVLCRILGSGR